MKKLFIYTMFVFPCLSIQAQKDCPEVIPALQSWKNKSGYLNMQDKGTIIVSKKDSASLWKVANILSDDMQKMFGFDYDVVLQEKAGKWNILLSTCHDSKDLEREEAYRLSINKNIEIEAESAQAIMWGSRTLLQMIKNQSAKLKKGTAIDYPEYASRGFMLDVGRKFFSLDYLKDYVKIMSFYKMNELHIHLNDNGFVEFFNNDWNQTYSAFRLESDRFPGLTSKDGFYTKEEFRDLQIMANEYGVKIIPEIDIPAHSLAFTHYNPKIAADKHEYGFDHLDLYKKEVYEFADALFDEYLSGENPVFVGDEVHIGTDEYNLAEAEQFRYFTNYYIDFIKKYGKTPRLWGSLDKMQGNTKVDLNGTVVSAWNYNWMNMESAIKSGAKVVNMCDWFLYIVPAVNYYHDFLDIKWLYNEWTPELMGKEKIQKNPNLLGAMFAVWNDRVGNGISEQDVHYRSFPAVQVLSDKLWKGDNHETVSYEEFERLCKKTPEAPGVNLLAKVDGMQNITEENKEIVLNGSNVFNTDVKEVGYPYSVEFELCSDSIPAIDAVLFKGPHSEFIANWNNTGKFAFRRDGYEFVFHNFRLPEGKWTHVRVEGDYKGTTLCINGERVERLEGRIGEVYNAKAKRKDRIWYQETLIFPLQTIGDKYIGFKGKIKNVNCIPYILVN